MYHDTKSQTQAWDVTYLVKSKLLLRLQSFQKAPSKASRRTSQCRDKGHCQFERPFLHCQDQQASSLPHGRVLWLPKSSVLIAFRYSNKPEVSLQPSLP